MQTKKRRKQGGRPLVRMFTEYEYSGKEYAPCAASPDCLKCPLSACKYDDIRPYRALMKERERERNRKVKARKAAKQPNKRWRLPAIDPPVLFVDPSQYNDLALRYGISVTRMTRLIIDGHANFPTKRGAFQYVRAKYNLNTDQVMQIKQRGQIRPANLEDIEVTI